MTKDNIGVNQLLLHFQNALYGTMVASVLYYLKFTNSLTIIGFEINPYNPCVTKKAFDESQMKI